MYSFIGTVEDVWCLRVQIPCWGVWDCWKWSIKGL